MKKVFIFICISQLLFSCTPDEEVTQVTQDQINNSTIVIEIAPDYQAVADEWSNGVIDTSFWFGTLGELNIYSPNYVSGSGTTNPEDWVAQSNVPCQRYYIRHSSEPNDTIFSTSDGEYEYTDADITKWHFSGNQQANISMKYQTNYTYKIRIIVYNDNNQHIQPTFEAFPFNNWTYLGQPIELDNSIPSKSFVRDLVPSGMVRDGIFNYNPETRILEYDVEGLGLQTIDLNEWITFE